MGNGAVVALWLQAEEEAVRTPAALLAGTAQTVRAVGAQQAQAKLAARRARHARMGLAARGRAAATRPATGDRMPLAAGHSVA